MADSRIQRLIEEHRLATDQPLRKDPPEVGVARVVDRDDDDRLILETPNGGRLTAGRDFNAAALPGSVVPISPSGQRTTASAVNHCPCAPTPGVPHDEELPLLLKIAAIAPIPIEHTASRVGGHTSPMPADLEEASYISKTGKIKSAWIAGSNSLNHWWDKEQQETKKFFFTPDGVVDPPNPADKIPYGLWWLGYGFWSGDWRKIPPTTSSTTTTVSGLFTTTRSEESCPVEVISIFLDSKERYPGTFTEVKRVVMQRPGDVNWDPNNPYTSPPEPCTMVCVPDGAPIKGVGRSQDIYYFSVGASRYPGAIRVAPFSENLTRAEILSAYRAAYSQYGEANCADGPMVRGDVQGGRDTSAYPYTCTFYAPFKVQELNCTCNSAPQPPPPPPIQPQPPPAPDPPGLRRTEEYSLLLEVENIKLKPGLERRIRWEETRNRVSVDGVETMKTQSRKVDVWFPLVKNEAGDAVIALQVFQDNSAAEPPPLEIRFWWSPPGATALTPLERSIFEPILLKDPDLSPYKISVPTPIEETKGAEFYLFERLNPVPDLFTPIGGIPYLARVRAPIYPKKKAPTPEDPNPQQDTNPTNGIKAPATKNERMIVDFWELPTGRASSREFNVLSMNVGTGFDIKDYSFHPGPPNAPIPT